MRGRSTRPTGQKKNLRRGDSREPPFSASTRKGWVQGRPLIRPGFAGPPSPRGEGFCTAEWCGLLRGRFKMLSSIVSLENASQIGLSIPEEIAPRPFQGQRSQNQRVGTSGHKNPGPGRSPGVLSPGFLPKKAGPPPGAGRETGRCAPRAASELPTQRARRQGTQPGPTAPP